MDNKPPESEWKKSTPESLEREYSTPEGIQVREKKGLGVTGRSYLIEKWQDVSRVRWEWRNESEIAEVNKFIYESEKRSLRPHISIKFSDKQSLLIEQNIDRSEISLKVSEEDYFPYNHRLSLEYSSTGKLTGIRITDEEGMHRLEEDEDHISGPKSLSTLLNYIRTSSETVMVKDIITNELADHVEDKYPDEDHPSVIEARELAKLLVEELARFNDESDALELLGSIGAEEELTISLLEYHEDNPDISIEDQLFESPSKLYKFLNTNIEGLIKAMQVETELDGLDSNPADYTPVISLSDISETEFRWRASVGEGKDQYGKEFNMFGNKYIITKDKSVISVICNARDKGKNWRAVFPVNIQFREIEEMLDNKDVDFREIKSLLSEVSFQKEPLAS